MIILVRCIITDTDWTIRCLQAAVISQAWALSSHSQSITLDNYNSSVHNIVIRCVQSIVSCNIEIVINRNFIDDNRRKRSKQWQCDEIKQVRYHIAINRNSVVIQCSTWCYYSIMIQKRFVSILCYKYYIRKIYQWRQNSLNMMFTLWM
jgi:hypothetical protein